MHAGFTPRRFRARLEADLATLEYDLHCCATAHAVPASYHVRSLLLLAAGAVVAYAATVWLASPGKIKPGKRRQ